MTYQYDIDAAEASIEFWTDRQSYYLRRLDNPLVEDTMARLLDCNKALRFYYDYLNRSTKASS